MGAKPLKWLSDEWIDMLKVVFDEAERIGMTCDLIVGSGWPFGAETLSCGERASVMLTYARKVNGGERLEMSKFHIFKSLDPGVTKVNPGRTPELVSLFLAPDSINDLSEAIDLSGDIEGDEDYRRGRAYTMIDKYVSSAAHLTGKRLAISSLEFLKVGSDMIAASGVTHSVWHGFNYSPL